ncbi:hypothetical protein JD844_026057 [Phrynosoma platyrhinos]|uniref:RING-type domain-containing protein n=1 Tax=Phrynosoma platyrhinos TaxID=52577 RepID=A0ABQ7SEM9_PHRPL|nr:hypothetical protein JD844_026057 [Phrynosoma platyrhinos]
MLTIILVGSYLRDYIRHEMEHKFYGAVYQDPIALGRFATTLTSEEGDGKEQPRCEVIVVTLCALLLRTKQVWRFSAPLLPLAGRLCCLPLQILPTINIFAAVLTALEVLYVIVSGLSVPFQLVAAAFREITQALEVYHLVTLGMSLWRQLAVPLLFLVFWLALFTLQICALASSSSGNLLSHQGLIFIFLSSVAECCSTPYSLIGLTFTISYLALGLLKLCKFYLAGYGAFQNGNVMHRGVTEGVTLLLLALQTGLLDLQLLQRTFLLSIILFIVVTSTLQSMIEIADPIVLGLGASRNRSFWKHFRGVSMCLFLLVFPGFMAYKIAHFFHMDFWLLILVSSCMLTSLQVMGTLFIYGLFIIELFQDTPMEKMDEIIYYVNAISRVLEFLVAVCVVAYGSWESIFGEWSWMGASVIIIHCYFNVWLRAQSGWKSFLLRREAAKKISLLPGATREQLENHDDVCAICFQEMTLAVVMQCGHFFHGACLRKWFYVQDTCPLCHQPVKPLANPDNPRSQGDTQAAEPEPETGEIPGPEDSDPVAHNSPECSGVGRTAEVKGTYRGDLKDSNFTGPEGEDLQESGSGSTGQNVLGYTSPSGEAETSATAAKCAHGPTRLDAQVAAETPQEQNLGSSFSSSEEPLNLEQRPPDSNTLPREFGSLSTQVENRPCLGDPSAVLAKGRPEGLEKPTLHLVPDDPFMVPEGQGGILSETQGPNGHQDP